MTFDVEEECIKLMQIVNDKKFNYLEFARENTITCDSQINFVWQVLRLTNKYPQVESYLKDLLNHCTIYQLEKSSGWPFLHHMAWYNSDISVNAFEIILNYGVYVHIVDYYSNSVTHSLFNIPCNNHTNNILNLLIRYGVDLNIINEHYKTTLDALLDTMSAHQIELNEGVINCIMTLLDSGAITNKPIINSAARDFIEHYRCSAIKPAIKNENKM